IADDLYENKYENKKVFTILNDEEKNILLNRMMDKYTSLVQKYGSIPDTSEKFELIFEKMSDLRKSNSKEYSLETFLELTYPDFEILPVLEKYTPAWIRSMHKNHKAHTINKELCLEMATILYLSKGIIFSSMKLLDTRYTICSCPSPENGGGCVLTNWYYHGMSNSSLLPNEEFYGRRKDENGNILPCRYFEKRGNRGCIGCGCKHDEIEPRDFNLILRQADQTLEKYYQR
ncbi:MAG: hypothetical protein HQK78_18845, partial [Desulfobacterales bacterium]|nr:hypothetical protein [Desulfobacterales bacterium]